MLKGEYKRVDFDQDLYNRLFDQVKREYETRENDYNKMYRSKVYNYEFLQIKEFPTFCSDNFSIHFGGENIWVDGHGFVLVADSNSVYVCVRSWISKNGIESDARVARIFRFVMTENGWKIKEVTKIIQRWHEVYGWICYDDSEHKVK